jgi:hypothetical protein
MANNVVVDRVIQCPRLELLSTLPKSQKDLLLKPAAAGAGGVTSVTCQVEGNLYKISRAGATIATRRLYGADLSARQHALKSIAELFSHRIHDFFLLRGTGSRASLITGIVEEWIKHPDGQENTSGAPTIKRPVLTLLQPGVANTFAVVDHVSHQNNHCNEQIHRVKLNGRGTPLREKHRHWFKEIISFLFPHARVQREKERRELDDMRIEAEVRGAFKKRGAGEAAENPVFDADFRKFMDMLRDIAQGPSNASGKREYGPGTSSKVYEARMLLLVRAMTAHGSTPARACATLNALKEPGALHDLGDRSEQTMLCWNTARLLSASEMGFQLLCECIKPPEGVAPAVAPQWRTALKMYFEASDALIAQNRTAWKTTLPDLKAMLDRGSEIEALLKVTHEQAKKEKGPVARTLLDRAAVLHAEARQIEVEMLRARAHASVLRRELQSWTASPLIAAHCAGACIADPDNAKANLLPHRTLCAAVKLLQARELVDTAWLERKRSLRERALVPDKDEVMALAAWRHGFHDDRENSDLDRFCSMLNKVINEWMPREEIDAVTGEVRHIMPSNSPISVAFASPMTAAVTRRPIPQQAADFHESVGMMTRLLVAELKVAQGLEPEPHEALMRETLAAWGAMRSAIGSSDRKAELEAELTAKFEPIVKMIDDAARIEVVRNNASASDKDRQRVREQLGERPDIKLRDAELLLNEAKDAYPYALPTGQPIIAPGTLRLDRQITSAVRTSLLSHWLHCTELGKRDKPYNIGKAAWNAVISDLRDNSSLQPGIEKHIKRIQAELKRTPYIDHALVKTWATELGLLEVPVKEPIVTPRSQTALLFTHHWRVADAISAGGAKVDVFARFKGEGAPQSRAALGLAWADRIDINLGAGFTGETSRTRGVRLNASVNTTNVVPGLGVGPAITVSGEDTEVTFLRMAEVSSSVGGTATKFSEGERHNAQHSIGMKGNASAAGLGVDGGDGQTDMFERGIGLRFPPQPGSRAWVDVNREAVAVLVGRAMAEAGVVADASAGRKHEALKHLSWQCIQPLLNGTMVLTTFVNQTHTATMTAGATASLGAAFFGDDLVGLSGSLRVGMEKDHIVRQSAVDQHGSTRVEIHAIGEASRKTVALKLLVSLLPVTLAHRIHGSLSLGPAVGISASFADRGIQQIIRREMRDGVVQPSTAWDISFRNGQDFVDYLTQKEVQATWKRHYALQGDSRREDFDTILKMARLHETACNQSFLARWHLKPEKLAELNAMMAIEQGLLGATGALSKVNEVYAIAERCKALLEDEANYEPGGVGLYATDRDEAQYGLNGSVIEARGEAATMSTEMLWFSARLTPAQRERAELQSDATLATLPEKAASAIAHSPSDPMHRSPMPGQIGQSM